MGVLNVTPDSFSDGGRYVRRDAAVRHAVEMVRCGADLIDVGGESTRPGAMPVAAGVELDRVMPVIEALKNEVGVPISIDTTKPEVMRAAVDAGVALINDVNALRAEGAVETVAALGVPVCLVHMRGEPRTMQHAPRYADVVAEVREFLVARLRACTDAGIDEGSVVLDPGFGFGKTVAHNLALLRGLDALVSIGRPVLVGLSRKATIARLLGREGGDRSAASIALALAAIARGARIVRVHDVAGTRDAIVVTAYAEGLRQYGE